MTILSFLPFEASLVILSTLAGILICSCALLLYMTRRVKRPAHSQPAAEKSSVADLQAAIQSISRDLAHTNELVDMIAATGPPRIGGSLDLTARSKILRLRRVGQSPEQISTAVRVPIGEVLLTLKVHSLAVQNAVSVKDGPMKIAAETRNLHHSFDM